jgi:peroxiredoxin
MRTSTLRLLCRILSMVFLITTVSTGGARAQSVSYNGQEKEISETLKKLRGMDDKERSQTTKSLAIDIRNLPLSIGKEKLASALSSLSTEGDFGHDTLQEVADTLSSVIREYEQSEQSVKLPYNSLAVLVRYEGVHTSINSPKYKAAMAELQKIDQLRADANFTLPDLQGKKWTLKDLKGKVVLINFWATWCPPCRKEMPYLEKLYQEFRDKNFIILGISDDDRSKLKDFVAAQMISYPILIDADGKIQKALRIEGIPVTLVYDRNGKLAAQAIDMRTRQQFLQLLSKAGLE